MFWQPPRSIFSNRRTEPPCFLNSAVFKANGILTPIDGDLDLPATGVCSSDTSDTTCCGSKPLSEKKADKHFDISEISEHRKLRMSPGKKESVVPSARCTPKNEASTCCTPDEHGEEKKRACCAQPDDGSPCCHK